MSGAPVLADAVAVMVAVDALVMGDDYRLDEDLNQLAELATSIAEHGVLQPLLVRQLGSTWEVVAGRRRLAAARQAGLEHVPCVVRELDSDQAADAALAENLHRRQLSPIEEALAYARLRDRGLNQTEIAARVGRSQPHVSMLLRLLELPAELRDKIHRRQMSYVTALDLWGRKRFRENAEPKVGGTPTRGHLTGDDATIASHWRRRHDRLLAGVHALLKARPADVAQYRMMIDRLLQLDRKPFEEPAA